jgi:hypothetical protein
LNFSKASCASRARAFASAAPVFAVSDSAIACAVFVSLSDNLALENCSRMPDKTIAPIVPINTIAAPIISTAFDTANKRSANREDISHINSRTVFGRVRGVIGAGIILLSFRPAPQLMLSVAEWSY